MTFDARRRFQCALVLLSAGVLLFLVIRPSLTQTTAGGAGKDKKIPASYDQLSPTLVGGETFATMMARDKAGKDKVMARQKALLESRYDLKLKSDAKSKMTRGKPIPIGPTAKLPTGQTWDSLAKMTPEEIRAKKLFPVGYLPLPHPHHESGGMVFPQHQIKDFKRLLRFDLDFDLPEHFLAEFPPAIFLITRPDLGDVSQGKVVSLENFHDLFAGILNPKQLEGLRLLLTQFPQQQFNATHDRKTEIPSMGVTCFDCHVNGHTSAATHLVGDIRPQAHRRRIDTPSLRGVNVQRLFGSQRALKSIEDFTEFEQLAAYFDGDPVTSMLKGINRLDRGTQVHFMSEFQNILNFPPAPNLSVVDGKLNPRKFAADSPEMKGQQLFFGKAQCSTCHPAPYYTDNSMHDLQVERFYAPQMVNGMKATAQGPIKTFTLRGIKDSPPYFHDGRLLTLEDTVEFFNLILETRLTAEEKRNLVAFLKQL